MLYHRASWKYYVVLRVKRLLDPRCRASWLWSIRGHEVSDLLKDFLNPRLELNQLSWRQLLLVPGIDRLLRPILPLANRNIFARTMSWHLYVTATKSK